MNTTQAKTDEEARARAYLFRVLARRGYFSSELRAKLLRKGYSAKVADKVLGMFTERGFINDEERRTCVIQNEKAKGRGPRRIAALLRSKGVHCELEGIDQEKEIQKLLPKLQKKYERQKLIQHLVRRGFDFASILSCLEENSHF